MIALGMVPMKVGIDDVAHRLGGNFPLDLGNQRSGRRWLGVRINHDYVLRSDEYACIAVGHRLRTGASKVNSVGNFLYVEQFGIGTGSRCPSPGGAMPGKFQNGRPSQGASHPYTKEVAPRRVGMMVMDVAVIACWLRHASLSFPCQMGRRPILHRLEVED